MGFYNDMNKELSLKGHIVHLGAATVLGGGTFIGMHHHVKKENNGQGGSHPMLKAKGAAIVPEAGIVGAMAYGYKKRDSALGRIFYHGQTLEDMFMHGRAI